MPRKKKTPTDLELSPEVPAPPAAAPKRTRKPETASASSMPDRLASKTVPPHKKPPQIPEEAVAAIENNATLPHSEQLFQSAVSEREQIALLAYSYWEARGHQGGSPEEDWYRAEREIRNGKRQEARTY